MKILHVIRNLAVATGGPVTALCGLAEAQAELGHDVLIVATEAAGVTVEPKSVCCHVVTKWPGTWSWTPALRGLLNRQVPAADILHLHMVWDYPVWTAARAAMRHGKPFILRPCGQLDSWSLSQRGLRKRAYLRFCGTQLHQAAAIHFTSEGERHGARHIASGVPSFVIPIGIAEAAYSNLPPRNTFAARFPQLAGRRIVLYLGRLHPKKQPDLLITAFAQVAPDVDGLHLVLAGPGNSGYISDLQSRVKNMGIAARTTFTGPLIGPAVTEAYRSADVFVLPSLQENFGIAIVEAMAASCPVLVSNCVDLAAKINGAKAGLTSPCTVEDISASLRKILGDRALRDTMGANGHRLVVENYSWEPIAKATIGAYVECLKS